MIFSKYFPCPKLIERFSKSGISSHKSLHFSARILRLDPKKHFCQIWIFLGFFVKFINKFEFWRKLVICQKIFTRNFKKSKIRLHINVPNIFLRVWMRRDFEFFWNYAYIFFWQKVDFFLQFRTFQKYQLFWVATLRLKLAYY